MRQGISGASKRGGGHGHRTAEGKHCLLQVEAERVGHAGVLGCRISQDATKGERRR